MLKLKCGAKYNGLTFNEGDNRPFFMPGKMYHGKKNMKDGRFYHVHCNNGSKFYLNGGGGTKIISLDDLIAEFERVTDAEFDEVKE